VKPRANTDIELGLLLEAIFQRYHYDFRNYAVASLKRRINSALIHFSCESISRLQERMLREPQLFNELLRFLTVQVSDLFRDPSYFRSLRDQRLRGWKWRAQSRAREWDCNCRASDSIAEKSKPLAT